MNPTYRNLSSGQRARLTKAVYDATGRLVRATLRTMDGDYLNLSALELRAEWRTL